jgi:hypothetical protein
MYNKGERELKGREKHERCRQGFDMTRGKSTCGVVPCGRWTRGHSSELEARPNGAQKGKEKYRGAFGDGRSTAETPPMEGGGIAFLRRNSRKTSNYFRDRYMGQKWPQRIVVEKRGAVSAAAKKNR